MKNNKTNNKEIKTKSVTAEILINSPKDTVWHIWSDFGRVADYVASVPRSYPLGDTKTGLSAKRRCELSKKMSVDERIIAYEEGQECTFEIYHSSGIPIKKMVVNCKVFSENYQTKAVITFNYAMKGFVGFLPMKGMMKKGAVDHLFGLKHFVETGEKVESRMIKSLREKYRDLVVA